MLASLSPSLMGWASIENRVFKAERLLKRSCKFRLLSDRRHEERCIKFFIPVPHKPSQRRIVQRNHKAKKHLRRPVVAVNIDHLDGERVQDDFIAGVHRGPVVPEPIVESPVKVDEMEVMSLPAGQKIARFGSQQNSLFTGSNDLYWTKPWSQSADSPRQRLSVVGSICRQVE